MNRWANVLVLASICVGCGGGQAEDPEALAAAENRANAESGSAPAPVAPAVREVMLPEGTTLRLTLQSAVASDSSRVEDTVRAALREAVVIDGTTILPAGTELTGVVTDVEESGRVKGRARIAYRFNSLNYSGERYDIATAPLSHLAPATKSEDATKIAVGAGAGAAIGALL